MVLTQAENWGRDEGLEGGGRVRGGSRGGTGEGGQVRGGWRWEGVVN